MCSNTSREPWKASPRSRGGVYSSYVTVGVVSNAECWPISWNLLTLQLLASLINRAASRAKSYHAGAEMSRSSTILSCNPSWLNVGFKSIFCHFHCAVCPGKSSCKVHVWRTQIAAQRSIAWPSSNSWQSGNQSVIIIKSQTRKNSSILKHQQQQLTPSPNLPKTILNLTILRHIQEQQTLA